MPEPESGPNWRRLVDGSIEYRENRRSQTYTVSEQQLARLRSSKMSESVVVMVTILPAAATVLAWMNDALAPIVPAIAAAAYVGINLAFCFYCSRQRRQVLGQASPSSRELLLPSMTTAHSDFLDKLSDRERNWALLSLALLVLACATSLAMTLGNIPLRQMHPLPAVSGVVIIGPLLYLHARDWLRRRRSRTSNGPKGGKQ